MNNFFSLESALAKKVWSNFEKELQHYLKPLPFEAANDIKLEILSHVYDSAKNNPAESEELALLNAIERYGPLSLHLAPMVQEILTTQRAKRGYPMAVMTSLMTQAQKGILSMITTILFGFCYFFVAMVFVMSIVHIFDSNVGIWLHHSGGVSLSFNAQPHSTQWLPEWFSLMGFCTSVVAYIILNKLLGILLDTLSRPQKTSQQE